ncbi:MAG: hypothetical protein ABIS23_05715 [Sphingomicrobium sp.]
MAEAQFGIGAYSLAEAGALLNVSPTTIRRWLFGYHYDHHGPLTQQMPLWRPQYGVDQEEPLLGFRDLMEARIVRGLRMMGIGLPTIRECLKRASEFVDDSHPFSTKQFRTDGKRLFLEQSNGFGDTRLLDLKARQNVFKKVVEPTFKDLEYGADAAARWWLIPNRRTIVIDPERSFGQPIAVENGVTTARLAQAARAEGSVERVARIFEMKLATVRDALAFEGRREFSLAA